MGGLAGADVRATFMDAWPDIFVMHSPPFHILELSSAEYGAVRRMHRAGPWCLFDCNIAKRIAGRVGEMLKVFGAACFVRLGYGSWAPRQMEAMGRLTIESTADVARLLTLRDRRLAEIAHRYVRGRATALIVRQFIDARPRDEVRVLVQGRSPVIAWRRHAPHGRHDTRAMINITDIERKIPLCCLAAQCPGQGTFTLDFIPAAGTWQLIDINPYFASPT